MYIRNFTSNDQKRIETTLLIKVSAVSVFRLQSFDQLSKGFMVTGIIADNQIF